MSFESYFRACSYATIACGVLALAVSGGVGAGLALAFAAVLVVSWKAAGTRWQLSERAGMIVVLLSLPAFYLDWNFQRSAAVDAAGQIYAGVSALVHFTLLLSSIKLLQVKSDRDWLFLYLISFFEVLLAACLFALIIGLAFPVFLITPRAAENMLGMPGGAASSGFVGFSDRVTLGDIGRLNQSNELVMRVRVEGPDRSGGRLLRWRGVALDNFNGRRWRSSPDAGSSYQNLDGNLF